MEFIQHLYWISCYQRFMLLVLLLPLRRLPLRKLSLNINYLYSQLPLPQLRSQQKSNLSRKGEVFLLFLTLTLLTLSNLLFGMFWFDYPKYKYYSHHKLSKQTGIRIRGILPTDTPGMMNLLKNNFVGRKLNNFRYPDTTSCLHCSRSSFLHPYNILGLSRILHMMLG